MYKDLCTKGIRYWKTHTVEVTLFLFLLVLDMYLRFNHLYEYASLGWDQIDSAWAVKSILVDNPIRLEGVPVKGNSGIYMGPLYYYLVAIVYFFTNLDPIASPIFAGIASIVSFFIIYFITKDLFNYKVALVAVFINTFSFSVLSLERIQNGLSLIVPVSYVIFYLLYKVLSGKPKYILYLAIAVGFSFHVDFTSVLYPLIIFCALPFFPRNRQTLKYILISLPVFLLFLLPIILADIQTKHSSSGSFVTLFNNYFHGLHLTRVLQLTHDAFLSFAMIFGYQKIFDYFAFLIAPVFALIYYLKNPGRNSLMLIYLIALWFLIPWIVLSTYRGELTNAYFSFPQNIAIFILAYFTVLIFQQKMILFKIFPILFWGWFVVYNMQRELSPGNLLGMEGMVKDMVTQGQVVEPKDKDMIYYIYAVQTHAWKKK